MARPGVSTNGQNIQNLKAKAAVLEQVLAGIRANDKSIEQWMVSLREIMGTLPGLLEDIRRLEPENLVKARALNSVRWLLEKEIQKLRKPVAGRVKPADLSNDSWLPEDNLPGS